MSDDVVLTNRQLREKNYYAQFSKNFDLNKQIDFSPIDGPMLEKERRPWNSYWRSYEIPVDYYRSQNEDSLVNLNLLDFGCGPGDNALRFSRIGYNVTGFDICEENIKKCNQLFAKNNCASSGHFVVSTAENLPFADGAFDMVVGIDILHHVEIWEALVELRRVLKVGGMAIFREPLDVPLFDKIRKSQLGLFLFPNSPSLETHITHDEKKLNTLDLKLIEEFFPNIIVERSLLFSRFDKFFRESGDRSPSLLEKLDYWLIRKIPALERFGGAGVIIVEKSKWNGSGQLKDISSRRSQLRQLHHLHPTNH